MKKIVLLLLIASFVATTLLGYAGEIWTSVSYSYDNIHQELKKATTISLYTEDEGVSFDNPLAVTAFRQVIYKDGVVEQARDIKNIQYELVYLGNDQYIFRITDYERVNSDGSAIIVSSNYSGLRGGLLNPAMSIDNVILGVSTGPIAAKTEIPICVILPDIKWYGMYISDVPILEEGVTSEIQNVVISDLKAHSTVFVLDEVQMGEDNKVILEKLDEIQESINNNDSKLDRIIRDIKRLRVNVVSLARVILRRLLRRR